MCDNKMIYVDDAKIILKEHSDAILEEFDRKLHELESEIKCSILKELKLFLKNH